MKKLYITGAVAIMLVVAAWYLLAYQPTRIALVNFRDSQMAEIVKANDNWFIRPEQVDLQTDDFSSITDYPVIYLFHLSTLTETQRDNLKKAMNNGGKVHVLMATSKENDLSNVSGEDLNYIKACFDNEGLDNIRKWLNYSRNVFDDKSLFVSEIESPKEYPDDVFYRIGTEDYFESAEAYREYYRSEGLYREGRPTIALVNVSVSPQTLYRSYQDSMILNLEARGFNVVAISGFRKRLANLKSIEPDMVLYFPHGRLNMLDGDATVEWLREQNILMMIPQLVHQSYEDWMADQQGMAGGLFGQNIVVPELDGAIHPYAVAAEYLNEQGHHTFRAIPGRIDRFCETAERWLSLREKANAEKKLSIFYYKGAGKNALVAGGLEVGQSIYSVLKRLKQEGYDLGDLPDDFDLFMKRIHRDGPLLGDYAAGTFEKFLQEGNPAYVSVHEYEQWCKTELDPESYRGVLDRYGPAPGKYMTTTINDTAYFAIPRVQFGNVSLLPVLPAAMETNEFKLAHGVKQAPPHAYIASYLWPRMKEQVDVVAHLGAHGSVEFTPWKQVVLSLKDWPEALIAPVPHLYIYAIDNIGEAMMAKRRTYATMVSHLTPSMAQAELYGGLEEIQKILHNFSGVEPGDLKEELRNKIRSFANTMDLEKDLGLTQPQLAEMNNETAEELHNYVHHLGQEKITMGLHTFGVPYSDKELKETVKLMTVNPVAQSLAQLAGLRGDLPSHYERIIHHSHGGHSEHHHNEDDFQDLAYQMVSKVLEEKRAPLTMMAREDLALLDKLQEEYGYPEGTVISEYYGGSYAKKKSAAGSRPTASKEEMVYDSKTHKMVPKSSQEKKEMTMEDVQGLALHLSAMRKTAPGVEWIGEEKGFNEITSLLDRATLRKFTNAAQMDPSLQLKVDLINNEHYQKLLTFVQDSIKRGQLLGWLRQDDVRERIEKYRAALDAKVLEKATDEKVRDFLFFYKSDKGEIEDQLSKNGKDLVKKKQENVTFFVDNQVSIVASSVEGNANLLAIQAILKSGEALEKVDDALVLIGERLLEIAAHDRQLLAALIQMKESLLAIDEYRQNLVASPVNELDAFVNGMKGGYVAPSSGGDPVSNPLSTPTGKNLYSINSEVTPTAESYELGRKMAEQILQKHIAKHGDYPKKIAYTLWGGEFIRNQGLNIGQILYMLGVEPVRNQRGRVHDVRLIPIEELKRPRIDVVVQTSGQFRDIAASRIYLINKAIALASQTDDGEKYRNFVKEGTTLAEQQMKEKGMSPAEARKFSTVRVFGGVNGNYGTAIMGLVEQGDKWEAEEDIAKQYIQNMGAMYSEDSWSQFREGMFETMLQNTEVVIHPRSSNVTGPISLDHVYEFMGGMTASIRVTTGKDPDGYFNDFRNKYQPDVVGLKEAIWTETRTNLFNPKFIKAQMEEGETAAENFAENFRDTYGWNVMKPAAIDKEIWEGYYDIYVKDSLALGTLDFFRETNPYALQEMTAVMLETIRKGYWKPSEAVTKDIVNLHAVLVRDYQAGCSGFVCDNGKLKTMIENNLGGELKEQYREAINTVRTAGGQQAAEGMVLKKEVQQDIRIAELIQDNLSTILILIGLLGGAIGWGVIKRRR